MKTTKVTIESRIGNEAVFEVRYADFFAGWFIMTLADGSRAGIPADRIAHVMVGPSEVTDTEE